jgi:hypothetical protein
MKRNSVPVGAAKVDLKSSREAGVPAPSLSIESLRDAIVGIDADIETPFGTRPLVYCDYTASGRSLLFVERYLQGLLQTYANTHTEDDITGRGTSRLLHEAEQAIKRAVNAGPEGRVVACGTGATGAIARLQQLLGVAIPPVTRSRLDASLQGFLGPEQAAAFASQQAARQPVVFVGPYEHHSNEISWRQGLATGVEVDLARDGGIDLAHLERLLADRYVMTGLPVMSNELPFSAAWNILEQKYHRDNWNATDGYYRVGLGENRGQDFQPGWVGGLMNTLPLMHEGSDLSRDRAMQGLDFVFTHGGQGESGFFHGCYHQGVWSGDGFDLDMWTPQARPHPDRDHYHLLRKSADVLYFLFKQFDLIKQQQPDWEIPEAWERCWH